MASRTGYIYMVTNKKNGTLYTGVTSNLPRRIWEHKNKTLKGFTSQHKLDKLIYYEEYSLVAEAIHREKQLKKWDRKWKLELIEKVNPCWNDLYESLL